MQEYVHHLSSVFTLPHRVEVSLEKVEGGVGWPWLLENGASLAEGEKQASSRAETAALPQEEVSTTAIS